MPPTATTPTTSTPSTPSTSSTTSTPSTTAKIPFLDAIVCDPPYGVRAGAKRCGTSKKTTHIIRNTEDHVTMTQKYETEDVMLDLLDMAASMLVVGGRLVYLLPCLVDFDSKNELPTHPCLKCVANSEQELSQYWSRRLITMEKIQHYDPAQANEYLNVAREQISKAQSRHKEASVAYTDLQNKIKNRSRDSKKLKVQLNNTTTTDNTITNREGTNTSSSSSSSSSSTSQSEKNEQGKKRKGGTGDGTEITLRKRARKMFVTPVEIPVEAGNGRAHSWSYYSYKWRESLITEKKWRNNNTHNSTKQDDTTPNIAHSLQWNTINQFKQHCNVLFDSNTATITNTATTTMHTTSSKVNDTGHRLVLLTKRGSIWGSCAQRAYDALSTATHATSSSSSFLPNDLIVSKYTIAQHLAQLSPSTPSSIPSSTTSTTSTTSNAPPFIGSFGVQTSIKFSPYGSRDEAGLYLWLDPLNYIKVIVEGARRTTSKPEITIGTQQNGLPTSCITYWSAKGLKNVEDVEYTVRLEIDEQCEKCAGMIWCELEQKWHVIGILSLVGSANLRNVGQLKPMVCTFTPKLHKAEKHQGKELSATFSKFQVYKIDPSKQQNRTKVAIESKKLKLK